ncbi:MAG: orotidine 5'-phosphate decarboxylase [Chloroflexi bacterium]|nr:orotidine 5'-phosphate decarboxylase [Chloroflexota bacterium]MCY3583356.1 orotidine 5'-phosphate decarboxylase [Chloroflexota bacterium]MCY3717881.1 orotidine 5'-phosphate decarboxylase [Chloroflexota bacterium]MDE2650373.1 orotidine 5'-phosphate decarboxylase [Chloroflexota bacterium]MXV93476.1 3-hexulose-6-phosphate synthase [Chloroflexota bacterium]
MPKLQLALDGELDAALEILAETRPFIDIAEVGTPLIYREGLRALRQIHALHPDLSLLADLKIMDAGEQEAAIAFSAGADIVTALALANDATIAGAARAARNYGKRVMADMMQVANPLARGRQLLGLGCDFLCLHRAHDLQAAQAAPYAWLAQLRSKMPAAQLAIAGGITLDALPYILPCQPQVIIVGSAITQSSEPAGMARRFAERIRGYDHS